MPEGQVLRHHALLLVDKDSGYGSAGSAAGRIA